MLGKKQKKTQRTHTHLLHVSAYDHSCLLKMDLNVHSFCLLILQQEKVVIGVAYDCVEKMIYWTEITSPSISKASIEGGEPAFVIRSGRFPFSGAKSQVRAKGG